MPKTISFNTGRKYTAEGQFIKATLHADGVVTFMDHSRSIDGEYTPHRGVEFNAASVLAAYDSNAYKGTTRSFADGMYRGACNARS